MFALEVIGNGLAAAERFRVREIGVRSGIKHGAGHGGIMNWNQPGGRVGFVRMCGRFTLTADSDTLAKRFAAEVAPETSTQPRYNIAPTQNVIIVRNDGRRVLVPMRWGLIPSWAKDPTIASRLINARAETLAEKPSFRAAFAKRRCLICATGFYEWQKISPKEKQPVFIRLKTGEPFGFAGLWEHWRAADGAEVLTCAIITTAANELMRPIHERMPVILPTAAEDRWLDPTLTDPIKVADLLQPYPASEMECYPVSRMVNSPANDRPECIVPVH
jgi:putative SOS response-associated peptidase YedK